MVLLFALLDLWKEGGGVTPIFSSLGNCHFHNTVIIINNNNNYICLKSNIQTSSVDCKRVWTVRSCGSRWNT